jgi:hypothetical protein
MWFQVELPKAETITEMQFESSNGGGRGGRGGAGRGIQPAGLTAAGNAPATEAAALAAGAQGGRAGGAPPNPGYPRGYKVETSMNGTAWITVAEGQGTGSPTVVTFKPLQAKFVRLTATASPENAPPLSIQQLRLYRAATSGR